VGVTAAGCGGAGASESTTPRPSDGVSTTITTDAPTTTLGDPSTTVIETTVPSTDAPTTTVAETTTTAFDASSVAPDLTPSVDISTPLGMALAIQAISTGHPYSWDGLNNVQIDFSAPQEIRPASGTDLALVREIYNQQVSAGGKTFADAFLAGVGTQEFASATRFYYPIEGVVASESTYGPVSGELINLTLPANATDDMREPMLGLERLIAAYPARVAVTSVAMIFVKSTDPGLRVLTSAGDLNQPAETNAAIVDIVTVDGEYVGYIAGRVPYIWPDDGLTYDSAANFSYITGAIADPDGRITTAVL
jgi:hypothetical protein